jgi:hypothetical protein
MLARLIEEGIAALESTGLSLDKRERLTDLLANSILSSLYKRVIRENSRYRVFEVCFSRQGVRDLFAGKQPLFCTLRQVVPGKGELHVSRARIIFIVCQYRGDAGHVRFSWDVPLNVTLLMRTRVAAIEWLYNNPRTRPETIRVVAPTNPRAMSTHPLEACKCGKTVGLKLCARCKTACYCSKECQKAAWPAHRSVCNMFQN